MSVVTGRLLQFPATAEIDVVIRVDLRYLLTAQPPYSHRNLNYRVDRLDIPDYGNMLSQQLRRLEGVSAVTITHYGCKVEIGALYEPREMKSKIRQAVEFTLGSQVPWTVQRYDHLNWAFRFGKPLIHGRSRYSSIEARTASLRGELTDFGYEIATQLRSATAKPHTIHPHHVFMEFGSGPDWKTLDNEFDHRAAQLVGRRSLQIDWE